MWNEEAFEKAKGAQVIYWVWRKEEVKIVTTRGTLVLRAGGDSCVDVWFESVESLNFTGSLLRYENADFTDVTAFDPDRDKDAGGADFDERSFPTLYTDRGRLMIELRCSSHYYSGYTVMEWIDRADEDPTP